MTCVLARLSPADQKRFANLRAHAALSGIQIHQLEGDFSPLIYVVTEGAHSRQLDNLDQVAAFLSRRTGKALEHLS